MAGRIGLACVIAGALVGVFAGTAQAADPRGSYRATGSVFLPYHNAPEDGVMTRSPTIGLSFGGPVYRGILDTGSTGIVVAARLIPDFENLPSQGEGTLTYTSSGRIMRGRWVMTPVSIVGSDDTAVTTKPIPVLGVTQVDCFVTARDCMATDDPHNIVMIGVGFGREYNDQSQSTPDKNPLLNLETAGRRGYVVTRQGIAVGLSKDVTKGNYSFVKLKRSGPDWQGTPACLSLNDTKPPACGTMLMDTGVTKSFMTIPAAQVENGENTGRHVLADGTTVAVTLPASKPQPLYAFTVGDRSNLTTPESVVLKIEPTGTFINTSFHFLNGFDYLYDADGGYVGFRPLERD